MDAKKEGTTEQAPDRLKCILCERKFKSLAQLEKHNSNSELHKQNLTLRDSELKGHIDRDTQNCLLCQRRFTSVVLLNKHVLGSKLHQENAASQGQDPKGSGSMTSISDRSSRPMKRSKKEEWMDCSSRRTVYIWDLDETLIIFQSLLETARASKFEWEQNEALDIGHSLEELIFDLCDTHMFFKQIQSLEAPHVDSYTSYDSGISLRNIKWASEPACTEDGKPNCKGLALRYRAIRDLYQSKTLADLLPQPKLEKLASLLKRVDELSGGWLAKARAALDSINTNTGTVNIIVSSGQLTPTLAKLMLFGLNKYFKVRNVYSSKGNGKRWCFEQIMQTYGQSIDRVHYRVVGDGPEEREACEDLQSARDSRAVQEPLFSFCQIVSADELRFATDLSIPLPRCNPAALDTDARPAALSPLVLKSPVGSAPPKFEMV
eukprot:gb/GEZN01005811.1/.p1 GENE.gb/GEZN01005811.1/~~gb/GEZN01005811.1/.p1  ORF type:complete len:434 (-),score=45.44 gb/GEZN01005811.1/:316-1617(-)